MNPAPPVTRMKPSTPSGYRGTDGRVLSAEQPLDVVERQEDEQQHEQHGAERDHALEHRGAEPLSAHALEQVHGDVPAVERQDREQVDESEVEAEEGEQHRVPVLLDRLLADLDDAYRPGGSVRP